MEDVQVIVGFLVFDENHGNGVAIGAAAHPGDFNYFKALVAKVVGNYVQREGHGDAANDGLFIFFGFQEEREEFHLVFLENAARLSEFCFILHDEADSVICVRRREFDV